MHVWRLEWTSFETVIGAVVAIAALVLVPFVLLQRKEPSTTIAWILSLVFLPALGAALFLLFGRTRVRTPARRKRAGDAVVRAEVARHAPHAPTPTRSATEMTGSGMSALEIDLFRVGAQLTQGTPTQGNRIDVLLDGNEAYDAMGAAIDAATHHVHAEFYLIRDDATGAWFRDRLVAAAKRGVEVRLCGDGYGCFFLGRRFVRPLRRAGAKVAFFLPLRAALLQPMNLRNHRKIVVVDGKVGFTGGLNVGDEYRGTMAGVGEWKDLHVRVEGAAVADLQRVFLQDWAFASGEVVRPPAPYFPEATAVGDATLAIVPSGPDTRTEAIHRLFFGAIAGARERVWVTTPYFVPDQAILVALELAALRGVDVRILLPSRSNHRVTFHAGRSFYDRLLEAGVRIYEYRPGIVHAKAMVVDGAFALVGSANMDLRSFRLNFEVHTVVHAAAAAARLEESFTAALASSDRISLEAWRRRSLRLQMLEGASRLVSPLL